ncbi:MAG: nucleotidyltransferase domain-containing protein [Rhodocyclaceae bacterium]|nr:nucleotidyltransferase domain-containing protein [Rhodocyclaceae bacterium]
MNKSIESLLNPADQIAIERILAPLLMRTGAKLKLFGSRARGDARRTSDIDLAIIANQNSDAAELAAIREALEESNVPFRIDLIDYSRASPSLQAAIDQEGIPWPEHSNA